MKKQKYCIWMITGGTTHALCALSACVKYAIKSERLILPFSETHPNYGTSFYSFYKLNKNSCLSRYFVTEENYGHVRDNYVAPCQEMPTNLIESIIDGPKPDSAGNQRYFLRELYSAEGEQRYLDYPNVEKEEKEYIMTWGRHNHYWAKQLQVVLETLSPAQDLASEIQEKLEILIRQVEECAFVGVHFRNTDYKSNIEATLAKTINSAKKAGITKVLWATDDSSSYEYSNNILKQNGLSLIKSNDLISTRITGSINIHSIKNEDLENLGTSKIEQMAIFFSEVLMLSRSYVFIPSSGTVPFLIDSMRKVKSWQALINDQIRKQSAT